MRSASGEPSLARSSRILPNAACVDCSVPAYRQVNPAGKVPALVIDDELLTENVAILYRIATTTPAARLLPVEPPAASRQLSLMAWFGSTLHILRRQVRMPLRFTSDMAAQAKLVEDGRPKMWEALQELERRLGDHDWFGGATFGVADGYALVFYDWGLADDFPMEELTRLGEPRLPQGGAQFRRGDGHGCRSHDRSGTTGRLAGFA